MGATVVAMSLTEHLAMYEARTQKLETVIRELLRYENDMPHGHEREGFWDETGHPCVRCATWQAAREAVE